jgi:hypothetical protein
MRIVQRHMSTSPVKSCAQPTHSRDEWISNVHWADQSVNLGACAGNRLGDDECIDDAGDPPPLREPLREGGLVFGGSAGARPPS